MLILFLNFLVQEILPRFGTLIVSILEPVAICVIAIIGLGWMLSLIGLKPSKSIGTSIADNLCKGIGYCLRQLGKAIRWVSKKIWNFIPKVYKYFLQIFIQKGVSETKSKLFAFVIAFIVAVIII